MASFIFGEGRHLREAHGNIKACHQRVADQMEPPSLQEQTLQGWLCAASPCDMIATCAAVSPTD
jgi:hypothetical protein